MRPHRVESIRSGYCLLIQTVIEGVVPYERDSRGLPVFYEDLAEIQRVLAEAIVDRLDEFLVGEREFEDAITVEEFIAEVALYPDGTIIDGGGNVFSPDAPGSGPNGTE